MMFSGEYIIFLCLALVALAGGILMLSLSKVVHMVVALVFTFVSIAGLYVLLSAEFVAAVQILIYSGAITIIMLFGIMLTKHNDQTFPHIKRWKKLLILLSIFLFAAVTFRSISAVPFDGQATGLHEENTKQIGIELYSTFIIPFELTSVLLLVALIGAIILAKKDDEEANESEQ
ncbi:NADH-quinone oxidoreductase subunit J [Metabacillus iocasae]|uniref:NADH-quinone oxidoreductase subunit J n=1 Tax=Priestia iocasae TaxID=2291674 RepID=A0ABS2QX29_9BACI|nr:NADH-quinone oxidoreductase subunit J [Metabacillus iocasae]MBM7704040.1 NADH-quinone oxidoreductase subunit J [Metabacillus iocasae]